MIGTYLLRKKAAAAEEEENKLFSATKKLAAKFCIELVQAKTFVGSAETRKVKTQRQETSWVMLNDRRYEACKNLLYKKSDWHNINDSLTNHLDYTYYLQYIAKLVYY